MRKIKKLLSIMLVSLLAITMSACSGTNGDGTGGSESTSTSNDKIKISDIDWNVGMLNQQ